MKKYLALLVMVSAPSVFADERDQAYRIHNRLTCAPPSKEVWDQMTDLLKKGDGEGAAKLATQNRGFLECKVKQWCQAQTNEDRNFDTKLNDYCATVIGAVRDDKSFGELLYSDIIYVADPNKYTGTDPLPPFSVADNLQYEFLDNKGLDLAEILVEKKQSEVTGIDKTSGLLTSRGFAEAYLSAGTNRRAVRYTLINYLCNDLEQLMDTTRSDTWVGRDVERDPGGDATTYNNRCKGCHAGQDFFRGAWAYFDYDVLGKKIKYTPGVVAEKYNINGTAFPAGHITTDDSWMNNWLQGQNAKLGFPTDLVKGNGVSSFGQMISKTEALNTCMAKKVFSSVCAKSGDDVKDKTTISELAADFKASNQNVKRLFVKTALRCHVGE